MFQSLQHKFQSLQHMFQSLKYKFQSLKHKFLLGEKTFSPKGKRKYYPYEKEKCNHNPKNGNKRG